MRSISLRRRRKPLTKRERRQRHVNRAIWTLMFVLTAFNVVTEGWSYLLWFLGGLVVLAVVLVLITMYVDGGRKSRTIPEGLLANWEDEDTPPDARVYRGHPDFFSETQAEANARRMLGVPDVKRKDT